MDELYMGLAKDGEERRLLRFLDKVFTRIRAVRIPYFSILLPKLYKKEYAPCSNNLIVSDGKNIRAAVGFYMMDYAVGKGRLSACGIGNVAVGKKYRGMGYMKQLMNEAARICMEKGTDFMVLGGKRQRYNYFGYERLGLEYHYDVNSTNLRHVLGGGDSGSFSVRRLRPDDKAYLERIFALRQAAPVHIDVKPAALYDVLRSWLASPYVLIDNGEFAGYFVIRRRVGSVDEIRLEDNAKLPQAVSVIFEEFWSHKLSFTISPAEGEANLFFRKLCEYAERRSPKSYLVLSYRRVLEAVMNEAHTRAPLAKGELRVKINGFAGEESLLIAVDENGVSVTEAAGSADCELEHLAAMRVFFDQVCPERDALPAIARAWFPQALFFPSADMV
ncbi:MAG: GNAT family N-acetyltransferase [Clostridium sp.]|jgi:hypothetical protein|nr:GNAT family N-acetyltransferase [Clostridium sp.]